MKFYIIRIKGHAESEKVAARCLNSIRAFYPNFYEDDLDKSTGDKPGKGYFNAFTPDDNPENILRREGIIDFGKFKEVYSRYENCIAAFCSHYHTWKSIAETKSPAFIFEHDAIINNALPISSTVKKGGTSKVLISNDVVGHPNAAYKKRYTPHFSLGNIVNIGQPSYGKFNTPSSIGINPLTSKRYFPGAHGYYVTPDGARRLMKVAKKEAGPTDIFLSLNNFPELQEWYPWSCIAKDNFSTIQRKEGILAKHTYNPNDPSSFKILKA
jgi:hypothetical protein